MDEDQILQSIIADPKLTDPSIDVGQLRQTTPTRAELLADVPEFSGLKFDPTQRSYIEDLYTLYGGGAPMLPVEDTAQIPGAIDTLVDVGGGESIMDQPAGDSVLDTTPTNTEFEQNLIDQGIGVQATPADPVVAPGEMPLTQDDFDAFNEIAVTPQSGITGDPIDVGIPDNESGFVDPLGTIGGPPVVGDFSEPTTGTISDDRLNEVIGGQPMAAGPFDYLQEQTPISQVTVGTGLSQTEKDKLAGYTPSFETPEQQESFLQNVLGRAGQTVDNALNELGKVPGAVVDFANETVDIFGRQLNVGKTLAAAAINKLAGGPISLVFDAIGALGIEGGPTLQTKKADSIGLLNPDTTSGYKDKYGINTQSAFGDYDQYNIDRVEQLEDIVVDQKNRGLTNTIQMQELEDRKEYNRISGVGGDITPDATPTDVAAGNLTGDATIAETIAQQDKNEIQPTDPSLDIPDRGRGNVDTGPIDMSFTEIGPDFGTTDGRDDSPAPEDIPDRGRGQIGSTSQGGVTSASAPPGRGGGSGGPPSQGGGSPGGGKIICTMMNESYGFGSFRNKIWLRHSKGLAPEYQKGYHKIFLPLVKLSKTNKILKKTLEHIAVHRTIDIRQESRGKVHLLGRVYRKILEPICYWVGKYAKR